MSQYFMTRLTPDVLEKIRNGEYQIAEGASPIYGLSDEKAADIAKKFGVDYQGLGSSGRPGGDKPGEQEKKILAASPDLLTALKEFMKVSNKLGNEPSRLISGGFSKAIDKDNSKLDALATRLAVGMAQMSETGGAPNESVSKQYKEALTSWDPAERQANADVIRSTIERLYKPMKDRYGSMVADEEDTSDQMPVTLSGQLM